MKVLLIKLILLQEIFFSENLVLKFALLFPLVRNIHSLLRFIIVQELLANQPFLLILFNFEPQILLSSLQILNMQ